MSSGGYSALGDPTGPIGAGPGSPGTGGATLGAPAGVTVGAAGSVLGRYRVVRLIGQGGMGAVYEAMQENPRRTVALKVIRPEYLSASLLRRFELEAQVLARLQHPGIAHVYEAGMVETESPVRSGEGGHGLVATATLREARATPFFAMELIQGVPLTRHCAENTLDEKSRLRLVARVCDAVQHAHQRGVIHRDLKPANILVDGAGQPKVLDFGVARLTDSDIQTTTMNTEVGQIVGTLAYMSPEQAAGDPGELDTRSDVYALGVITYELLAGRLPHDLAGKPVFEALRLIREVEPAGLSTVLRSMSGDVETIVAKAMDKDKARRYQSAGDLAADIERYLAHEPIAARPASAVYQIRKFARRNKVLVGGVMATFLALVVGLAGTIWKSVESTRNASVANARLAETLGKQAELARQRGQWKDVIAAADEGLRIGIKNPLPLLFLRLEAVSNLDPRNVDTELGRIEAMPGSAEFAAPLELWRAEPRYSKAGEPEAIVTHARRALELGLGPADAAYARAIMAGTIPESIGHLRGALEADPFHSRANQLIISLLTIYGEIAEAIRRLEVWRLVEPGNQTAAVQLTQLYALTGRLTEAGALIAGLEGRVDREQITGLERAVAAMRKFNATDVAIGIQPWVLSEMLAEVGPSMAGFGGSYTQSTVAGASIDPMQQGMTPAQRAFIGAMLKHLAGAVVPFGPSPLKTSTELLRVCPSPMVLNMHASALMKARRFREASDAFASIDRHALFLQLMDDTRLKGGLISTVYWYTSEKDDAARGVARARAVEFGRQIMARGPVDPVGAADLAHSGAVLEEAMLLHGGLTDLRTWEPARPVDYPRALAFHALNKNQLGVLFLASHGLARNPGDGAIKKYRDDALTALRNDRSEGMQAVLRAGGFVGAGGGPPAP